MRLNDDSKEMRFNPWLEIREGNCELNAYPQDENSSIDASSQCIVQLQVFGPIVSLSC